MKYIKVLLLVFVVALFATVTSKSAYAVACSAQVSTTVTVSSSCTFANTADGVDSGSGTSNTGTITISGGATLTVGAGQTIAYGSITKGAGGGSIIKTGGGVLLKAGIWYTDADADGYPASTTAVVQSAQPANGRRKNVMTSVATADCADADNTKYQNLSGYTGADADGDTYRTGSVQSVCSGASLPATASASQDCYDSNANAHPGQTTYYKTDRGDTSFDYDCSGVTDKIIYGQDTSGTCANVGFGTCSGGTIASGTCGNNITPSGDTCNGNYRGVICCH